MTGSHIGILKNEADQLAIGKIGYVIGEKYQRKGYAGEALLCLLKIYLKDRLKSSAGTKPLW